MTPNPSALSWFEIPTADLERARTFYETALGITLRHDSTDPADAMYIFPADRSPEKPAVTGALVHRSMQKPSPEGAVVYFNCSGKLEQVLDRVPPAGGSVLVPKTPVPGGFGAYACVADTEGNHIGLHTT